jgi:hypothetical protein
MSYDMVEKYPQQTLDTLSRQTLRERLLERQKRAQENLNDITQALEFLDKNPQFEAFHNLIGKTGF